MAPSTKNFEVLTSNTAMQSQYPIMVLELQRGPIQVLVDVQAASKIADEKRRSNIAASQRFRRRQKKKKQREISENIAKLEAKIRKTEKE